MLIPRRVKHRKQHHPKRAGKSKGGTTVAFGDYGVQAMEPAYVTNRQIEAARIAMTRHIKRGGKVWRNIYPTFSATFRVTCHCNTSRFNLTVSYICWRHRLHSIITKGHRCSTLRFSSTLWVMLFTMLNSTWN